MGIRPRSAIACLLVLLGCAVGALLTSLDLTAAEDGSQLWSFRQVRATVPPDVKESGWPQTPIDQFILAQLEERGMSHASFADRRTLLRRITFDLIGLPPDPDDIEVFLNDESPDAFDRVVDRLLASPQYGERWGRHWLDVVRYADARDLIQLPAESDFREAWRYRDWVVTAMNQDLPYDQFVRLQLAGDLFQPANKDQIDADALVATGLLAIADFVPGDVDKEQMIADYVNDQIDVVGRAFLGLTLACARCHDHKFDPVSIEDYYSLAGIFFSTRLVPGPIKGNTPLVRVPLISQSAIAAIEAGQARDKLRIAELTRDLATRGERDYRHHLEQRVQTDSQKYAFHAWQFTHPVDGQPRAAIAEYAQRHELDSTVLQRWVAYFDEATPHPSFVALRQANSLERADELSRELADHLTAVAATRRGTDADSIDTFEQAAWLNLRADDRRLAVSDSQQVTEWPNRGVALENGTPVADVGGPRLAKVSIGQNDRTVLRFSGNELLQVPVAVPAVGSLFVVFRSDPNAGGGQRLIGWEDSAVGQHGLGIMIDGAASAHLILRRNGASGDVVTPATAALPSMSGFQIICITWGPDGVTVYRNGQLAGSNKGIDSVSSDPMITALHIGGSGSGGSPRFHGDLAELQVYRTPLDSATRARIEAELVRRWSAAGQGESSLDPIRDLYDELTAAQSPFRLDPAARVHVLSPDLKQQLASLRDELDGLQKKPAPEIPKAVVVQDGGPIDTPHAGFHDAHVYLRGNHQKPGDVVPRGFPKSITGREPPVIREGSGRKELAAWLTNPQHPLTARVMVNRIWQHHFGIGLVPTSNNFGVMGDSPSHPELLDDLAVRFVSSGWSMKRIHRLIVSSSVYQQSSVASETALAKDPENRRLWRFNRRRLQAEAIRDSLFNVGDMLDTTQGGPGFQPVATPRRSLYQMAVRTGAKSAEFAPLFDAPDCSGIVERRSESIVAPQALFLLNDPLMTDLARSLGERVIRESPSGELTEQIKRLYLITLGRLPTIAEIDIGRQLVEPSQPDTWTGYCRLMLCTNEFLFVD